MIKLVIFDLGNVLLKFDFTVAARRLEKVCSGDPMEVFNVLKDSNLARDWDMGILSPEDFYTGIQRHTGCKLSLEEFLPIWNEIFTEDRGTINLAMEVKKDHKIMILSNTNPWHVAYIRTRYPWVRDFDGIIASCDVRLMKPDRAIYELSLEKAGVRPEESIFIDDLERNVAGAKAAGMGALHFSGHAQLRKDLRSLGILAGSGSLEHLHP
jgi:putative hydrolase of the HAD superfamily